MKSIFFFNWSTNLIMTNNLLTFLMMIIFNISIFTLASQAGYTGVVVTRTGKYVAQIEKLLLVSGSPLFEMCSFHMGTFVPRCPGV